MKLYPDDIPPDWRFEYKYRLTYPQYYCVRAAVLPYLKRDPYTLAAASGRYLVRSLYFDTGSLGNYTEKVAGDCDRVKLRVRTYSASPSADTRLRVELKARKGISMEKYSSWVDYPAYQAFMDNWHWPGQTDAVLDEFERYVHLKTQRPKIIVEYAREGYAPRGGESVRVTFDHRVRSASAAALFPKFPFFRSHHPGWVVFEIKCRKQQPAWLRELVWRQGLRVCANSKYAQGIEAARPDLVWATWSE